jgi:hypothetical protein
MKQKKNTLFEMHYGYFMDVLLDQQGGKTICIYIQQTFKRCGRPEAG